jgi:nicotinamide/nicotinate riboside kinase
VWPAYIKAHEHLFSNGDVDAGQVKPEENLLAMTPGDGEAEMTRAFDASCEAMMAALRAGKGRVM